MVTRFKPPRSCRHESTLQTLSQRLVHMIPMMKMLNKNLTVRFNFSLDWEVSSELPKFEDSGEEGWILFDTLRMMRAVSLTSTCIGPR